MGRDYLSRSATLEDFGRILQPDEAQEPILARGVRAALLEWLLEIFAGDELKKVCLPPRKKAIFSGPPGVGKTTLAHHLAARIGLPLYVVEPDRVTDIWVNSNERPLRLLAESMETASPALMRQFAEGLKRQIVIGPKAEWNMAREAVIERILAAVHPHPDCGLPRLWSLGAKDTAICALPWPLPSAEEAKAAQPSGEDAASAAENVVSLGGSRR